MQRASEESEGFARLGSCAPGAGQGAKVGRVGVGRWFAAALPLTLEYLPYSYESPPYYSTTYPQPNYLPIHHHLLLLYRSLATRQVPTMSTVGARGGQYSSIVSALAFGPQTAELCEHREHDLVSIRQTHCKKHNCMTVQNADSMSNVLPSPIIYPPQV